MRLLKSLAPAWIVVLAYAGFCLWARARLPDAPIATHFDGNLHANGWMPRDQALFVPLGVYLAIMLLVTASPFFIPPKGALERSAKAYGAACLGLAAFFAIIFGSIIGLALGWPLSIGQIIASAMGALFLVLGNYMTKVRYNLVFGVRTPWTLANESVWDRTHRLAGPLMMAGGAFILLAGLLRPAQMLPVILIGALVPAAVSVAYSWWLWSKLPPDDKRRIRAGA